MNVDRILDKIASHASVRRIELFVNNWNYISHDFEICIDCFA
jgi:hypothetical protein